MKYDVTLLGATGFTGKLTAQYLAEHMPKDAPWAIAGRNEKALQQIANELTSNRPDVIKVELSDEAQMDEIAKNTKVLATTVGPYLKHGEPAVKAAAKAGIGYVDLTGEPQFVDQMWLNYNEIAQSTGAKLVHTCGFDSIPYDLGVYLAVKNLPNDVPIRARTYVRSNAGFSGGTYYSAINQFASMKESAEVAKERRRIEPRPDGRKVRGESHTGKSPLGGYQLPLPTIDPQVVLRSARSLAVYGPAFTYEHYAHFKTLRMPVMTTIGLSAIMFATKFSFARNRLLKRIQPGEGPSAEKRARSYFKVVVLAEGGGKKVRVTVKGGDPGYSETSKMLAEAAMALAYDALPVVAGQLTPAVAMGDALLARYAKSGPSFSVEEID